ICNLYAGLLQGLMVLGKQPLPGIFFQMLLVSVTLSMLILLLLVCRRLLPRNNFQLQQSGWRVELVYLALPNVELSCQRVAERVKHGGHGIPEQDLLRRFPKSLKNLLQEYSIVVDHCICMMNQGGTPELVFENFRNERVVHHQQLLDKLTKEAGL